MITCESGEFCQSSRCERTECASWPTLPQGQNFPWLFKTIASSAMPKVLHFVLLQDRNETLFYKLLLDNFTSIAPIVYTPTVGWACLNYHHTYRRPRGMFFSLKDRGDMVSFQSAFQRSCTRRLLLYEHDCCDHNCDHVRKYVCTW